MSVIQKMLAAECLDPLADVYFTVILHCRLDADVECCRTRLAPFAGEIHTEKDNAGFLFLLQAEVGIEPENILSSLAVLLDEEHRGVSLLETKYVNARGGAVVEHSFNFTGDGIPDDRTVILSPSQAFGSGDHPSTGLAIAFLEQLQPLPSPVLDVGCGTGVLSFVAARLGATSVLGVDIDEEGLLCATQNARLNRLEAQTHFENKPLAEIKQTYPLILANLTCSVLQFLLKDLTPLVESGGSLVVSGLQGRQGVEAERFLANWGWLVSQRRSAGKWQALLAVKS